MQKEIYLIQGLQDETYRDFAIRISGIVTFVSQTLEPAGIKYTITAETPPLISIIPFSRKKIAAISVYHHHHSPASRLKDESGFYGAYNVTEALPVAYDKDWPDGEETPGVCLLTVFSKKKTIDYPTFIDRWHNSHTPLSLRTHPLWNYNRNVVTDLIAEGSAPFDAIVEEQVRTKSDLLNPFKFFGNPVVIIPNMISVYADTKSFIDYPSMDIFLTKEYVVKSIRNVGG